MKRTAYPFSAIVGQERMKLALLLAAIDWRLGVLLRGDKGAGKTTTARGLAALLPEPSPFTNLPIGVTEDRLLGGLHLESTLNGTPTLKPGLLSEAHGGVLYIDEVNLLPAHLGDALLDTVSSGVNIVEREGFSISHPAEFVLLGSMNPEEGLLRPQLLDRFALSVDIAAPLNPTERQAIVERRVAFERNPARFAEEWAAEQEVLSRKIIAGRERIGSIACRSEIFVSIGEAICAAGVHSLRADLATVRASIAYAALLGDEAVELHHVDAVLPLVLNHRAATGSHSAPPPPSLPPPQSQESSPGSPNNRAAIERIFAPQESSAPALQSLLGNSVARGVSQAAQANSPGPVVRTRRTESPKEIDLRATLNHAVRETGELQLRLSDLHEKVRAPKSGTRYLFVIDSSGSHAAQEKMSLVKGATLGLLRRSFRKDDEVVILVFRGTSAQVLLEPCRMLQHAVTALEYLPTGGRTPLAHALELAKTYLTPSTFLILLSDGRANVSLHGGDPWHEALTIAGELNCRALVIDTETSEHRIGRISELASILRASSILLADIGNLDVLEMK